MDREALINLAADIVSAHVQNNTVALSDVPRLIETVHGALARLGTVQTSIEEPAKPAVPIRASVKPDHIVCLEDGKKLKLLKRHLMIHYQMTPGDYRVKWGLAADYPMVAPNYTEMRRNLAKKNGLGRKPGQKVAPKGRAERKSNALTS